MAPAVLRSAQPGRDYTDVCRPETDAWVRLGSREGALLLGLSGVPVNELQIRFADRFTSGELSAALERFQRLGLLMDARSADHEGVVVTPNSWSRPEAIGAIALVPLVLLATAMVSVPLVARHVSWQGIVLAKPSLLGVIGLSLLAAVLHEAGHAVAAMVVGRGRLTCALRWGWLAIVPVLRLRLVGFWGLPTARRMVVTGAGCVSHLVLAAACVDLWVISLAVAAVDLPILVWYAALNVALAAINVLPVYPLDGYWLLALAVDRPWLWRESRSYRLLSSVALGTIVAVGAAGVAVRVFNGR